MSLKEVANIEMVFHSTGMALVVEAGDVSIAHALLASSLYNGRDL